MYVIAQTLIAVTFVVGVLWLTYKYGVKQGIKNNKKKK
jgi:hypothetical protein